MTTETSPTAIEPKSTAPIPRPSSLWCFWQCIKGTSPTHLTIPDADLRGKWVILTGGNSGIGKEAAVQCAKWGANILLGCRQPPPHEPHPDGVIEECKAAALGAGHDGTVFEWWECDMANLESVEAFAKRWLAKGYALDILANNAGIGKSMGKDRNTIDGFEVIHQVGALCTSVLTF
jgi:NAD(P)-dependent dehydrogenase (short-subunit alcohol dehydrogenase family)